ncbi:MAG: ferrous iron transport protein A [Gammaproteobacteria bacterium]
MQYIASGPAGTVPLAPVYPLDNLPRQTGARVVRVESLGGNDAIARRIEDLGFVPGEPVRVIARGLLGGNPLVVQVGYTRFALRREEARRVQVVVDTGRGA